MSKKLDKAIAVPVVALGELGKSQEEIAEYTGVSQQVVSDILNSKGRWARIKSELWFNNYKQDIVRKLQTVSLELQKKALSQIANSLENTSAVQAGVVFGILVEKERLMSNQSTQNVSIHNTREESDKLDKALDRLVETLKADGAK